MPHLREVRGKASLVGSLLFIWTAIALWDILTPINIGCDGDRWPGLAMLPIWLLFLALAIGAAYGVWHLMNNRPGDAAEFLNPKTVVLSFAEPIYRAAPRMLTISAIVLVVLLYNAYFRYRLVVHTSQHQTLVHDTLMNTWRTSTWQDCGPDGPD